mgnify:CR=1 FL=1
MKLLLAGGGTGGHLFPGIALAQLLLRQEKDAEVLFVGTRQGLEQRLLPQLGLPLATVSMAGVVGRGWRGRLELLPKLLRSLWQGKKILTRFGPDIVIGLGGYASVPVLLAAKLAGIPYLVHEQNAVPGLSNRLLSRWAKLVCLSFSNSGGNLPAAKIRVTGNPLRSELERIPEQVDARGTLLVFGGSRGARALNEVMLELLPRLKDWEQPPAILHQTGHEDLEQVRQGYAAANYQHARVVPFIDDMVSAYREAALVICRAGATTLAELTVCGRPAILIPFPYAAADHQTSNARTLQQAGAARLLAQSDLTAATLEETVADLLGQPKLLQGMAEKARQLGLPGAAERILNECRQLLGRPAVEVD